MGILNFYWPEHRLFPYEKDLAIREVRALLRPTKIRSTKASLRVWVPQCDPGVASAVTYFSRFEDSGGDHPTSQACLERNGNGTSANRRQSTRYSVHGLHEYKGKFNPQVAKAILNCLGMRKSAIVLDPFCGSGTALVECSHAGLRGIGFDLNPLAIYIANAKLAALRVSSATVLVLSEQIIADVRKKGIRSISVNTPRLKYLANWFRPDMLDTFETLALAIESRASRRASIFKVIVSNLLRDYSLQEPIDLRIRRRKSPFPTESIEGAFSRACVRLATNLKGVEEALGLDRSDCLAVNADATTLTSHPRLSSDLLSFDGAITSPPYATALPYIDTQRLSLVWLGLAEPSNLQSLQASLIGSREFYRAGRKHWEERLAGNSDGLPVSLHRLCKTLLKSVSSEDGFRRRAVPALLYRYLSGMRKVFGSVSGLLRRKAPFAMIVGSNHTNLGGRRIDIDTPDLLCAIALDSGFWLDERITLQAYQRYGLHHKNAVEKEELLIFRTR